MANPIDNPFKLRIKLDLGGGVIGSGKAELLRRIEEEGSISAAARQMGLNYRRAWFLIETLNETLGQPVVTTTKGGASGGGATLTEAGRLLMEMFEESVRASEQATAPQLAALQAALKQKT